ncbi:MAG: hypothetical protein M1368_10325 [Thaumarchaeota archaeon]|nr:hypothetical protein [Nitrososphaerota archaeon]
MPFMLALTASWLSNNQLVSVVQGVSIYGPYSSYSDVFDIFGTNVTNYFSGQYNSFQPFADVRMRLAFADALNATDFNQFANNNLGKIEINAIPPGLPPTGSYNSSIVPRYSFNQTAVQDLLLQAMEQPMTQFRFTNGTLAPAGFFNNTFGCATLGSNGQCSNPTPQTITLAYPVGWLDQQSLQQIASVVNNVSATYNMGLTVSVVALNFGQLFTEAATGSLYMFSTGWFADYPQTILGLLTF